jgi:hypothetical protein
MAARSSSRGAHPGGHSALRRTSPSPVTTRTQSTRGRAAAGGAVNGGATSPRRGPKDVPVVAAPAPPGAGIEAGSLKWQHPFVDVFRSFHVGEWVQAEKCGDVTSVLVGGLQPLSSPPFFFFCFHSCRRSSLFWVGPLRHLSFTPASLPPSCVCKRHALACAASLSTLACAASLSTLLGHRVP